MAMWRVVGGVDSSDANKSYKRVSSLVQEYSNCATRWTGLGKRRVMASGSMIFPPVP